MRQDASPRHSPPARAAESRVPKSARIASALLPSCSGAVPPEMFTLNRCAFGSFAVMLQNGSVMMLGGHLAHAELQQQHTAIGALAHEALVSSKTLMPCRTLQKRVVAHPRHELPAAVRASGDILAADLEARTAHVVVTIGVKAAVGKKLISVGKKLLGE